MTTPGFSFARTTDLARGLIESGATELPMGAVADGEYLRRSGATIDGDGPPFTRIEDDSGAAGSFVTLQRLTANADDNTSETPAVVMTTTGLSEGLYRFTYLVLYQSDSANIGIGLCVNYTGTSGVFSSMHWFVSTGAADATGVADGVSAVTTGQMVEGKSERAANTVTSTTAGVDAADTNCQIVIEGVIEVTGAGSLQLKARTETAGTAIRVMEHTTLQLVRM